MSFCFSVLFLLCSLSPIHLLCCIYLPFRYIYLLSYILHPNPSSPALSFDLVSLACHVDLQVDLMKRHPCMTSPCGPYSQCRAVHDQAVCTCLPGYYGSPPRCRPECIVSSDCNHDKTCINHMCTNPCLDHLCAANAACRVINHSPICSCLQGYTGDPFVRCLPVQRK